MPTTKYLGHEITTYTRDHGQETAHVIVDGKPECFLNGLAEAKRFLRERKAGEHYGPRPASWHITLDSGCSASYHTYAAALGDAAYWDREGRPYTLARREFCSYPGCDGDGHVIERGRNGRTTERPCPAHAAPIEIVECAR